MERSRRAFYVVQFIELPFEGIYNYVCVPSSWLKLRRASDQKASVAYPKGEDPYDTRDRVKRKERCDDEWRCYMAVVTYETDSYRDAEFWIAARNDYGPLVEVESNKTRTQPRLTLNRRLRIANQSHSSNLNDNPREPLLNISMKRPALSEPKKKLGGKRLKLDVAAPSLSSTVVNEAGCSRRKQSIIIQEKQSMECVQARETSGASSYYQSSSSQHTDENLQKSVPKQELNMNIPSMDVDTKLNSLKMSANLYRHMEGARRLVPIQEPIEKMIRPMSFERVSTIAAHNPPTGALSMRSVEEKSLVVTQNQSENDQQAQEMHSLFYSIVNSFPKIQHASKENIRKTLDVYDVNAWKVVADNILSASQNLLDATNQHLSFTKRLDGQQSLQTIEQYITRAHQNQYLPTNQNSFEHELHRRSTETNNYGHRPNSRSIRIRIPSIRQTLSDSSNSMHQTSEVPHQRQSQSNQQDSQRKMKRPKLRICISTKPKHNRQRHNLQGVTKKTPPLLVSESTLVNENHQNAINNTRQTHNAVTSNSDAVTIPGQKMSSGEAPVETMNNVYCAGNVSGSGSTDRPMAAQNLISSNQQTQPRVIFQQQMLNHLAANPSLSSNLTPEVPAQITEERHIEVKLRTNTNKEDQHTVDVANNTPKQFILPTQYDPHDTRWTLKYKTNLPGLVELMPLSGIYVSYGDLQYSKYASKDCKSLARRLLPGVFNRQALSVCLTMSETAQDSIKNGYNVRPELDKRACTALLCFIFEFGLQRGWEVDPHLIFGTLNRKMKMIRFKYGVMVQC